MQDTTENTCKLAAPSSIEYTKCNLCDTDECNSAGSLMYSLMTISLAVIIVVFNA